MAEKTGRSTARTLSKQEAIRHLIHAAIRMIIDEEDPLATHLIVQSADKTLIDIAKKRGKELRFDWELYIKDEFHKEFFKRRRAMYNFLKHADRDFADDMPIDNIMTRNLMDLYVLIANYNTLFDEKTNHMILFQIFVIQVFPGIIVPPESLRPIMLQGTEESKGITPREFFELIKNRHDLLPKFYLERSQDLEYRGDFYSLTFGEIRSGVKESPRKFKIREY
jgi:hypothetical protein